MTPRSFHQIATNFFILLASLLFIFYSVAYGFGIFKLDTNTKPDSNKAFVGLASDANKPLIEESEVLDDSASLIFVGDIMLSRGIGQVMEKNQSWKHLFLEVGDFLRSADLTFGNLEGPISSRGTNMGSIYSFRANPDSVEGLLYAGFDVLSVANNHMWDYGGKALEDTLSILKENGMSPVGAGSDYTDAHKPVVRDVKGTKIAFLAYTNLLPSSVSRKDSKPAVAYPDKSQMKADIENAKSMGDIVIVSFHFGDEYKTIHNALQEDLAHSAVDFGANLVVGHHPHVIQDTEIYKGVYIAYSLGNFIFDQNFNELTGSGLLLVVKVKDKKIEQIEEKVVQFNSLFQPYLRDE